MGAQVEEITRRLEAERDALMEAAAARCRQLVESLKVSAEVVVGEIDQVGARRRTGGGGGG